MSDNTKIMRLIIETDKIEFPVNTPVAPHRTVKFIR